MEFFFVSVHVFIQYHSTESSKLHMWYNGPVDRWDEGKSENVLQLCPPMNYELNLALSPISATGCTWCPGDMRSDLPSMGFPPFSWHLYSCADTCAAGRHAPSVPQSGNSCEWWPAHVTEPHRVAAPRPGAANCALTEFRDKDTWKYT